MILTDILNDFVVASGRWFGVINTHSLSLFFLLALFDTIWLGIEMMIEGGSFIYGIRKVVAHILTLGFFWTFIVFSKIWITAILDSFVQIGQEASGVPRLDPSSIVDAGIQIALNMFSSLGFFGTIWHPFVASIVGLLGIIVFLLIAWVASFVLIVLIQAYLSIGFAPLLLAFGGSRWTRPVAGKYLSYVLSTGGTLLALYCMVGIMGNLSKIWADKIAAAGIDLRIYLQVAFSAVVYAFTTWVIPHRVADMFAGALSLTAMEIERSVATASSWMPRGGGGNAGGSGGGGGALAATAQGAAGGGPVGAAASAATSAASHAALRTAWQSGTEGSKTGTKGNTKTAGTNDALLNQFRTAGNGQSPSATEKTSTDVSSVKNEALRNQLEAWNKRGKE